MKLPKAQSTSRRSTELPNVDLVARYDQVMAITTSNQDVYVGDELVATGAMLFHDRATSTITVKAPHPVQPGVWVNQTILRDAQVIMATPKLAVWEGTVDGEPVRVSSYAQKPRSCCGQ